RRPTANTSSIGGSCGAAMEGSIWPSADSPVRIAAIERGSTWSGFGRRMSVSMVLDRSINAAPSRNQLLGQPDRPAVEPVVIDRRASQIGRRVEEARDRRDIVDLGCLVEDLRADRIRQKGESEVTAGPYAALEQVRRQVRTDYNVVPVGVRRHLGGAVAAGEPDRKVEAGVRRVGADLERQRAGNYVASRDAGSCLRCVDGLGPFGILELEALAALHRQIVGGHDRVVKLEVGSLAEQQAFRAAFRARV